MVFPLEHAHSQNLMPDWRLSKIGVCIQPKEYQAKATMNSLWKTGTWANGMPIALHSD
jgi:hypothetical protein